MRYLILALLVTGCGSAQGGLNIDTNVKPYFDAFQAELNTRNTGIVIKNITITIDDVLVNKDAAAVCQTFSNKEPEIHINRVDWERDTEEDREALIYHELGHCVLGRPHVATMIPNPFKGAPQTGGILTCGGVQYAFAKGNGYYMPESFMNPCGTAASLLYGHKNRDPEFQSSMRAYYIDELITNRVVGYYSNF